MVPLQALIRLTRLWNLLIIGLAQYCTARFLISQELWKDPQLFLLSVSTILIAAGGYSINDYYDVKIDLINKPERVVVGKTLSRRTVLLLHSVLTLTGIGLGFLLSWRIGLVHLTAGFLLWLYSNALKREPFIGNLTVALLTGLAIFSVQLVYPGWKATISVYSLFAFFITLVREIIKDMEDLRGDNTFGCRTLPIVWGIRATKVFIYALLVLFAATVVIIHQVVTPLPVLFFVGFLLLPMGILVIWLIRADTRKDYYWLSQFSKMIMLAGIFSMAFL
ncbi:MAG: geranylgeranylglycerol-phosphate geranylgeranyltransferase [Cyclobacteriaceae bacterium]|nr:geranylgeranylglycerol-phosphate geranylgeranyltransferase [Cyclobacteriaceae bacterium]